jgi:hypothetical protein
MPKQYFAAPLTYGLSDTFTKRRKGIYGDYSGHMASPNLIPLQLVPGMKVDTINNGTIPGDLTVRRRRIPHHDADWHRWAVSRVLKERPGCLSGDRLPAHHPKTESSIPPEWAHICSISATNLIFPEAIVITFQRFQYSSNIHIPVWI